jgi:hypothetical protein
MTARDWTILVMAVVTVGVIAWDVYVAFFNRVPNDLDTISGVTLGWSEKVWTLPFAFGVLGGHLFWPALGGPALGGVWSIPVLLGMAMAVAGIGWWYKRQGKGWSWQGPILLVVGALAGHWLWPQ